MCETLPNCADWGLFDGSDFAGDLGKSKSTSGGMLCIFGSRTFAPISWMCKNQTAVSHSSTESEVISLDAGVRMDGIPLRSGLMGSFFNEVLHSPSPSSLSRTRPGAMRLQCETHPKTPKKLKPPTSEERCVTVIKMSMKGMSPTMRLVSRTHRVALDWLFGRINLDANIQGQIR